MSDHTTIRLQHSTKAALERIREKRESYDELLVRILAAFLVHAQEEVAQ